MILVHVLMVFEIACLPKMSFKIVKPFSAVQGYGAYMLPARLKYVLRS
jgi:hypothetical protein